MGKDKTPRIPSFAELGISEDEIEELEREIADGAAERERRESGQGAPAEGPPPGPAAAPSPGSVGDPGRAAASPGSPSARERAPEGRGGTPSETGRAKGERRSRAAKQAAPSGPRPATAPWSGLRGPLTMVVLLVTAWLSSSNRSMPAPVEVGAPDSVFSSGRAMAHLVRIASEARPPGSPAHARVRAYLLDELRALGHEPTVQTSTTILPGAAHTRAATIRNVMARIPGSEPGGRAVLVTAHYDGREIALGAGDDASGVVAIIESLRALATRGQLANDLIVLITDAEELGLLGARAFVDEHPWMEDVAVVVGIEMRGGGGPSMMFETGENNGWVVEQLRLADPYPAANSASYEIYRRMPNDTDFTPFREAGRQGLNFAGLGRAHVYHQVYDSPENLSEATVQHHGEHVLAMLEQLGNADLAAVDAPNVSYISIPYVGLVTYGAPWIWALGLVAVALWAGLFVAARRRGARSGAVMIGLLGAGAHLAMSATLAWYLFQWRSGAHPELGALHGSAFHSEGWYVLAIACVALALAVAVAGVLRIWLTAAEIAAGALILPVGLAAAATPMFPMAAMNVQWPAIAGCVGALALVGLERGERMGFARWGVALLAAIPVVVVLTPLTEGVWLAMGLSQALWIAVLVGLAFVAIAPALDVLREPNGWWAPVGVVAAGGAFLAVGMSTAAPSADRPAPSTLVYVMDRESGSAWWGTDPSRDASDPGGAWVAAAMGRSFDAAAAPEFVPELTVGGLGYAVAGAEAVEAPPPEVVVVGGTGGGGGAGDDPGGSPGDGAGATNALRVSVTSAIGAEMMLFRFDEGAPLPTAVNGKALPPGADPTTVEHWGAPESGVLLDFPRASIGGDLVSFTIVEHHLRPGDLVGADRFRRPSELAPNIRTLSDRAMIRTRVAVNPATGEVRLGVGEASGADAAPDSVEPLSAGDPDEIRGAGDADNPGKPLN